MSIFDNQFETDEDGYYIIDEGTHEPSEDDQIEEYIEDNYYTTIDNDDNDLDNDGGF